MDKFKDDKFETNDNFSIDETEIKKHLKNVFSDDVYNSWIDKFEFGKADTKEVIITYYGKEDVKEFEKEYKELLQKELSVVLGEFKSLKIYKRNRKSVFIKTEKAKKNIEIARLFMISMIFVAITLIVAFIGCNYIANRNFKETFYSVSSLKADNKIRVVQISDLHSVAYGKNNKKLINRVEKLAPDLILYTGDCQDVGKKSTERIVNLCESLKDVAPSYYIYGNNEVEKYYDVPLSQEDLDEKFGFNDKNRNPEKLLEIKDDLEKELEKIGVKVLKNETDSIKIGSTDVDIYGVLTSNPSSFWSYAGESFDEYIYNNTHNLKITALHEPFIFEEYGGVESWGDILVCGHTHGGTIKVPRIGPLYTHEGGFFPERKGGYVYGRYDVSGKPLIVSAGLENKNIFRINNQPELVIIDINRY